MKNRKRPRARKKAKHVEQESAYKAIKKPTRMIQVVCPTPIATEMREICELNCISMSRLITLSMRTFFDYLKSNTQSLMNKAEQNAPHPEEDVLSRPPLPEATVLQATQVRLPEDMWTQEQMDDVLYAAEDEENDYGD